MWLVLYRDFQRFYAGRFRHLLTHCLTSKGLKSSWHPPKIRLWLKKSLPTFWSWTKVFFSDKLVMFISSPFGEFIFLQCSFTFHARVKHSPLWYESPPKMNQGCYIFIDYCLHVFKDFNVQRNPLVLVLLLFLFRLYLFDVKFNFKTKKIIEKVKYVHHRITARSSVYRGM